MILRALWKVSVIAAACISFVAPGANAEVTFEHDSDLGKALKLPVRQWVDSSMPTKAIIVANHGMVFQGKAYDSFARHLAERGFVVYAQDFRGYGDWAKRAAEYDGDFAFHFTQTKNDLTAILTELRRKYPETPLFIMGESLGANYVVWQASTEPKLMDGVIAVSTTFNIRWRVPRPNWTPQVIKGFAHPKRPLNLVPFLRPILSDDLKLTDRCLGHPEVTTKMSATDVIKAWITTHYAMEQLERIPADMPMLLVAGTRDKLQHSERVDSAVERIGSKKVEVVMVPDRGHLLLECQDVSPGIIEAIDDWLDRQTAAVTTRQTVSASVRSTSNQ